MYYSHALFPYVVFSICRNVFFHVLFLLSCEGINIIRDISDGTLKNVTCIVVKLHYGFCKEI